MAETRNAFGADNSSQKPINHHVGRRIAQRRIELGVSRAVLARQLRLSVQQIQKYESGQSTVSASRLHAIAHQLGVTPDFFFDEIPPSLLDGAAPRITLACPAVPNVKEIRQMVNAYSAILDPLLRQRIYDLALSVSVWNPSGAE